MVSWHDCTLLNSELTQRWDGFMAWLYIAKQWTDTEVRWFMAWLHIVTQWIDRDRGEMVSWHDCILLHIELTETEVRGFHGMTVHCCTVNWLRWRWGSPKIPVVTQWVDIRRWDGFMAWFIDCTCSHSEWTQTVSVQVAQWKWILKGLMQMLMLGVEAAQWKWGDGWWRCWCWVLKQHSGSEERVDADADVAGGRRLVGGVTERQDWSLPVQLCGDDSRGRWGAARWGHCWWLVSFLSCFSSFSVLLLLTVFCCLCVHACLFLISATLIFCTICYFSRIQ